MARKKLRKDKRKANARFIARISGRKRAIPLKTLKNRLWTILSLWVRFRDKRLSEGKCVRCGANPIECCYHILPAGDFPGTRYDDENLAGCCNSCNFQESYHRLRESFYWRQRLGPKYDELAAKGRKIKKWSRDEVMEAIHYYEAKLAGENPPRPDCI